MKKPLRQRLFRWISWWPPLMGAGIRLTRLNRDFTYAKVELKLAWYNKNAVGTHFGGSLFAMTDPFYMLLLLHHFGSKAVVWDKTSCIEFKKPGKGTVYAEFVLSPELLSKLTQDLNTFGKIEPEFIVEVKNTSGEVVALVKKILYLRLKSLKKENERSASS